MKLPLEVRCQIIRLEAKLNRARLERAGIPLLVILLLFLVYPQVAGTIGAGQVTPRWVAVHLAVYLPAVVGLVLRVASAHRTIQDCERGIQLLRSAPGVEARRRGAPGQ